jgi:hypothetical protein
MIAKDVYDAISLLAALSSPPAAPCAAEELLDLYRAVTLPKGGLVWTEDAPTTSVTRYRLAQDLVASGPGFVFRAIVEEWSLARIVRELY